MLIESLAMPPVTPQRKGHEYYVATGNQDAHGDVPCVILSDEQIDTLLIAGYVEHVETQPDKTLMKLTKKYMEELAGATIH